MVKLTLTKAGLNIAVRSVVKPQTLMECDCGFDLDTAMLAAASGAESLNARFGDMLDPKACMACVKQFSETVDDLKCRHCGWRDKTGVCTQHQQKVDDSETCELFRCVHEVCL